MSVEVALPYRSDWREMANVLDYCKGKGAERSALEARFGGGESLRETLNALEQLELIDRGESGDTHLTVRGEQLAYAPDQSQLQDRLLDALLGYGPYRFPLERAVHVSGNAIDGPWLEHIWQVDMRLGQPRNRVEEARTFFYRLAGDAGLGTYRRGVRGQSTRLELAPDFNQRVQAALARSTQDSTDEQHTAPIQLPVSNGVTSVEDAPAGVNREATIVGIRELPFPITHGGLESATGPQLQISVDMSDWELDKIEALLRLVGMLPDRTEH